MASVPQLELVYFEGCPYAEDARDRVAEALSLLNLPARWTEWDSTREDTPLPYRQLPSPSVLVNGIDVAGGATSAGQSCAIGGGPTTSQIVDALRGAANYRSA